MGVGNQILLFKALRLVESFAPVSECESLLNRARGPGLLGGIPDLLIIADALGSNAYLFTHDQQMKLLAKKLGVKLVNAETLFSSVS